MVLNEWERKLLREVGTRLIAHSSNCPRGWTNITTYLHFATFLLFEPRLHKSQKIFTFFVSSSVWGWTPVQWAHSLLAHNSCPRWWRRSRATWAGHTLRERRESAKESERERSERWSLRLFGEDGQLTIQREAKIAIFRREIVLVWSQESLQRLKVKRGFFCPFFLSTNLWRSFSYWGRFIASSLGRIWMKTLEIMFWFEE